MEIFLSLEAWIALATLTLLEIVLGIDNIIFISIVTNKLPLEQQKGARNLGLALALIMRIAMLLGITWLIGFTQPVLTIPDLGFDITPEARDISGRDLILIFGGIFLLVKSIGEIHHKVDADEDENMAQKAKKSFTGTIIQIALLDLIFSFDSILTAVGMIKEIEIMIIAIIISMIVMLLFSGYISNFINQNPTLQILALSFLILIGFILIVDGLAVHVPKGYVYFALFFSLIVEILNLRMRKKPKKINQ